jgi:hypothetical protein
MKLTLLLDIEISYVNDTQQLKYSWLLNVVLTIYDTRKNDSWFQPTINAVIERGYKRRRFLCIPTWLRPYTQLTACPFQST